MKRVRDKHRQAIELLNEHTDEEVGFLLLKIEVYIDNNKEIYDLFYANKELIEEKTGLKYKGQRLDSKKASRIKVTKNVI